MDGLSAAASIVAVVQISGKNFDLCRAYYFAVKDFRKDIQRLRDETIVLQDVLTDLSDLVESQGAARLPTLALLNHNSKFDIDAISPSGGALKPTLCFERALQQCKNDLERLLQQLEKAEQSNAHPSRLKRYNGRSRKQRSMRLFK